jgi:hypothetical protein
MRDGIPTPFVAASRPRADCCLDARRHRPFDPPPRRTFHVPTLLLFLALALPAPAAEFRAGAAQSCITPQLGTTINPNFKREPQPPYTQIRRVAEDVAQEVLRVTKGLEYRREVKLRAAQQECVVATRRPNAAEVAQARAVVAGRPVEKLGGWTDNVAREQLFLVEWPGEVSMPIQIFRIGDLAVAAWPGEIFAASGLELKRRSPVKTLFNVGLANGWYGYIPPPEQFPYGAYETWRMRTSPLETNAIPKMLDGFLDLIETSRARATHRGAPPAQGHQLQP